MNKDVNCTITRQDLFSWLRGLKAGFEILAPRLQGDDHHFLPWEGDEINLSGYFNALKPVKEFLFPQGEDLVCYRMEKGCAVQLEAVVPQFRPLVLFGVRPCDARGVLVLDRVFLGDSGQDTGYQTRRKNTIIITIGCTARAETCFCRELGIDPIGGEGSDIHLVDLGAEYLVRAGSRAGEDLLKGARMKEASGQAMEKCRLIRESMTETPGWAIRPEILAGDTQEIFRMPLWDQIYRKCLNCGACTFLCPTCHCFDVSDEAEEDMGRRIRSWDSCMFGSFTRHGSGHNPRPTGKERVRQRVMHKFKYFPENNSGIIACVGCGRCVDKCPVNFDIRDVLKKLEEFAIGMPV